MEEILVIGADVRCIFTADDRIDVPEPAHECPKDSRLYRAELMEPGRFGENNLVAVKKFRFDSATTEAAQVTDLDLLMRWEDLTKLKHENVITYHKIARGKWMHQVLEHSSRNFMDLDFVMDYCDGSSLRTWLFELRHAKRTLNIKTLFDFSKQMANGLAYLHRKSITHGNLKITNVLVSQSSTNQLRLRLCGLHNFTSSYGHFVLRRFCGRLGVPPEVLSIIREGASVVLDDPYFSAFHMTQTVLHFYSARGITQSEALVRRVRALITVYCQYQRLQRQSAGKLRANELFSEYLQRVITFSSSFEESDPRTDPVSVSANMLQGICAMDSASAKQHCAKLRMDYSCPTHGAPVVSLDTVMSAYFRQIRAPAISDSIPETCGSDSPQPCSLCLPNQSVRFDGRKADMWSLGGIMSTMALCTFDISRKLEDLRRPMDTFEQLHDIMMDTLGAEPLAYKSNFIARDFKRLIDSCASDDKRITAEELINVLVALEEHTYGSTWLTVPENGVPEEKGSESADSHRQMLEEIGRKCEYTYSFLRDFLGQGSYGYVYKATVTRLGTYKGNNTVAIKQILLHNTRIKQMQQDHSWETAKKQWRKLIALKHPHLVTYHKVTVRKLTTGAGIEIMMDYCEGGDLDMLIAQCRTGVCRLSTDAVVNYATQLASGLHFLHEKQFIHGDLKPGNVFMSRAIGDTGNRTLRIGDIDGAVRIRDDSGPEPKDLAGTGPYMSPEMVMVTLDQEHDDVGFPTDVWSLGCVILDLANCSVGINERLFLRTIPNAEGILESHEIERKMFSDDAFLFQLSQGYHPFISELIPQDIRDVIQCCLVTACQHRATAALILEQLLCDANGDVEDVASNPRVLSRTRRAKHYWLDLKS